MESWSWSWRGSWREREGVCGGEARQSGRRAEKAGTAHDGQHELWSVYRQGTCPSAFLPAQQIHARISEGGSRRCSRPGDRGRDAGRRYVSSATSVRHGSKSTASRVKRCRCQAISSIRSIPRLGQVHRRRNSSPDASKGCPSTCVDLPEGACHAQSVPHKRKTILTRYCASTAAA